MGGPGGRVGTGRRTMAPRLGGQVARNLEESQVVEAREAQDTRTVTERVWQHLASIPCQDHQHTDPAIVPQTTSTWTPHKGRHSERRKGICRTDMHAKHKHKIDKQI